MLQSCYQYLLQDKITDKGNTHICYGLFFGPPIVLGQVQIVLSEMKEFF